MVNKINCPFSIYLLCLCLTFGTMCKNKNNDIEISELGVFTAKMFESDLGTLPYQVLYPNSFSQNKKYPLVIFLHGAGERGKDNQLQLTHGSSLFKDSIDQHPAIVLFPQCPKEDYWVPLMDKDTSDILEFDTTRINLSLEMVIKLIESYCEQDYIDAKRIYLVGLSMGGMGVWELLWRMPMQISAAVAICGGGPTQKAKNMLGTPIRVYHGELDDVVHKTNSIRMVKAIQQLGRQIEYIEYPKVGHSSWTNAFQEEDFLSWLFAQSK